MGYKNMKCVLASNKYRLFSCSKNFYELCTPLLMNTSVSSFYYVKFNSDNSYFHLATDDKFNKYMVDKSNGRFHFDYQMVDALYNSGKFVESNNRINMFIDDINISNYWEPMINEYNIKNSFNIIEKNDGYYESFWFITRFNKTMFDLCINRHDVLEKFILYFKDSAQDIFTQGEQVKIDWVNNTAGYLRAIRKFNGDNTADFDFDRLDEAFRVKKYPINNGKSKSYITSAELKCLAQKAMGLSYKEIGNNLNISHRTVEAHLVNVRSRFNIATTNQLLKVYRNSSLSSIKLF